MSRRGAIKQEFLFVVLFLVILCGVAAMLTLRNTTPDRSYIPAEYGKPIDEVRSANESETAKPGLGQDVPKDQQKEITTDSGLKYTDLKTGDGDKVKVGSFVVIYYTGKLTNGDVFESNVGKAPYTLTIGTGQVIKGWEEGLLGIKAGGKRKLFIPYNLAYGDGGSPPKIPGKADLLFEIEVNKVMNK